jgi:1-deoxy-D-xylulose-5-phosphate reductoisomerase
MKKISLLGSTGSIGTQCLDIVRENPNDYQVVALTCGSNVDLLSKQIEEFAPKIAVTEKEEDAAKLQKIHKNTEFFYGKEGLIEAAKAESQMVVNALMGMRGLEPTYHAIKAGRDIALANKETLVAGGEVIMAASEEHKVKLLPVDSEHSAIFQCLEGNQNRGINKILLTASGGPFRRYTLEQLKQVTLEQALKHPNWSMGKKITIDSATMMNKGLEVIEAKWLFNVDVRKIEILVHPQSILHSAVEFEDKSIIGQMGVPDMRIPISFALAYPNRLPNNRAGVDFFGQASTLTFEKPDTAVFKCIKMAYESSEAGGTYPVVLNGANEVLVDLFLSGKIAFIDIQNNLERILDEHKPAYNLTLEDIIQADKQARICAYERAIKTATV